MIFLSATFSFNPASTDIIISTAAPQTQGVYSATGTSTSTPVAYPTYNVSSVAASSSTVRTASSNFTLPSATATATLPPNFVMQSSVPYVLSAMDTSNLPAFEYTLLNESAITRQLVCDQQTQFCKTAGCANVNATINENFCNVDTMGTRCSCNKGSSNLQQWNWPVQMQDCLSRGSACTTACSQPGSTTLTRSACTTACNNAFSNSCGTPGQLTASYAVNKVNDKPALTMVQGGTAGDGALSLKAATGALSIVAAGLIGFVLL